MCCRCQSSLGGQGILDEGRQSITDGQARQRSDRRQDGMQCGNNETTSGEDRDGGGWVEASGRLRVVDVAAAVEAERRAEGSPRRARAGRCCKCV